MDKLEVQSAGSSSSTTSCISTACPQNITILLDGVFREFYDYLEYHATNYEAMNPHINIAIEQANGDFMTLQKRLIEEAAGAAAVEEYLETNEDDAISSPTSWDGSIFPAQITGPLVAANVLWDMTDYVRDSSSINWPDIMPFFRQQLAMYDQKVKVIPLDGDTILMYYRKDLFDQYQIQVPRTWEEYTNAAKFFHGKPLGPNNTTIAGSCISRIDRCGNAYWTSLLLSSMTQTQGTSSGFLFDPEDEEQFDPLLGPAFEDTLRYTAEQFQYGHDSEMTGNCLQVNLNFSLGQCAMTYNWGNQILTLSNDSRYEVGIAPTPGSRKVFDRSSGLLVNCTSTLCPHAQVYEDIGRVNVAPYAAFGGWAAGVNNLASSSQQHATANFFSYISNAEQSLQDVLPNERSIRFSQPYRYSHATGYRWTEVGGFNERLAAEFTHSTRAINSPNAVLELRIPGAPTIRNILDDSVFSYLKKIATMFAVSSSSSQLYGQIYGENDIIDLRKEVTRSVEERIRGVIVDLEQDHEQLQQSTSDYFNTTTTLWESYQQSLGVYLEQKLSQNYIDTFLRHAGWGLAGIICGSALLLMAWTWKNRNHRVMEASQPCLLLQCCFGIFILGITIVPLSLDESLGFTEETLDKTCMIAPWCYTFGFSIVFSSIYAKIRQCKKVCAHPELYNILQVSPTASLKLCFRMLAVNFAILTIWTLVDPLRWTREVVPEGAYEDSLLFHHDILPETYGVCKGESGQGRYIGFAILLGAVNLFMLMVATAQAFQCQFLEVEFNEIQWLPLALLPFIEFWLVGAPVLFLVQYDPTGTFTVLTAIITVSSLACILALFASKEWHVRKHSSKGRPKPTANDATISGTMVLKHPDVEDGKEIIRLQTNLHEITESNYKLEQEIRDMKKRLAESEKVGKDSSHGVNRSNIFGGSSGSTSGTEESGILNDLNGMSKEMKISRDYADLISMEDEEFEQVWKMESETEDGDDEDVAAVFGGLVPPAGRPLSNQPTIRKEAESSGVPSRIESKGTTQSSNGANLSSLPLPGTPERNAVDVFESPNKSVELYEDTSPLSSPSPDRGRNMDKNAPSYLNSTMTTADATDPVLMSPQTPAASLYENEDDPSRTGTTSSLPTPGEIATTSTSFASSGILVQSPPSGSLSMDEDAPSVNVPNSTFCSSNSSTDSREKPYTKGTSVSTSVTKELSSSHHSSSKSTDETKVTQATSLESAPLESAPDRLEPESGDTSKSNAVESTVPNVALVESSESSEEEWDPYFAHFQKAAEEEKGDDSKKEEKKDSQTQISNSKSKSDTRNQAQSLKAGTKSSSTQESKAGENNRTQKKNAVQSTPLSPAKSVPSVEMSDEESWDPYAMHFAKAGITDLDSDLDSDPLDPDLEPGTSSSEDENSPIKKRDYRELKSAIKTNDLAALEAKAAALAETLKTKLDQLILDDSADSEPGIIGITASNESNSTPNDGAEETLAEMILRESDEKMGGAPDTQNDEEPFDVQKSLAKTTEGFKTQGQTGLYPQSSSDAEDGIKHMASAGESSAAESLDTATEPDSLLQDPILKAPQIGGPTQNAGEPSRGDLRYGDRAETSKLSYKDKFAGKTTGSPVESHQATLGEKLDLVVDHGDMTMSGKLKAPPQDDAEKNSHESDSKAAPPPASNGSKFVMGDWAAVGKIGTLLADWSDSQSCSSFSSRADSNSSVEATKTASGLDTPLANELDHLVGKFDWDGIKKVAQQHTENDKDEEDHLANIEEMRRRKREIEAWRSSISNSIAQSPARNLPTKTPNNSLLQSPNRIYAAKTPNNSLVQSPNRSFGTRTPNNSLFSTPTRTYNGKTPNNSLFQSPGSFTPH